MYPRHDESPIGKAGARYVVFYCVRTPALGHDPGVLISTFEPPKKSGIERTGQIPAQKPRANDSIGGRGATKEGKYLVSYKHCLTCIEIK